MARIPEGFGVRRRPDRSVRMQPGEATLDPGMRAQAGQFTDVTSPGYARQAAAQAERGGAMEFGTSVGAERDAGRDALIMEIVGMVLAGLATGGVANTLGGGFAAARAGGASRLGAAGAGLSRLAGQGGASPAMGGGPWGRGPFNVGGQYVGRGSRVGQVGGPRPDPPMNPAWRHGIGADTASQYQAGGTARGFTTPTPATAAARETARLQTGEQNAAINAVSRGAASGPPPPWWTGSTWEWQLYQARGGMPPPRGWAEPSWPGSWPSRTPWSG